MPPNAPLSFNAEMRLLATENVDDLHAVRAGCLDAPAQRPAVGSPCERRGVTRSR
jgi:hypothetical protein